MQSSRYLPSLFAFFPAAAVFVWTPSVSAESLGALRLASDSAKMIVQQAVAQEESESLASVFTEDGSIVVPTGQVIRGRTTIRSMAALMMMTWGGGNLQVTRDTLQVRDSTGYEIGRFVFRRQVANQPDQIWSGSYTVVWQTEAGIWRMSRVTGLLDKPRSETEKPGAK